MSELRTRLSKRILVTSMRIACSWLAAGINTSTYQLIRDRFVSVRCLRLRCARDGCNTATVGWARQNQPAPTVLVVLSKLIPSTLAPVVDR